MVLNLTSGLRLWVNSVVVVAIVWFVLYVGYVLLLWCCVLWWFACGFVVWCSGLDRSLLLIVL